LILFIAMVAGALISYLVTAPGQIKARMTISNQRKRIAEVEGQLSGTQEELGQAQGQLDVIEAQMEAELAPASDESTATGDPGDDSET
jgi:cytochrome bd-type quinol oxidase subunit 1